MKWRPKLHTVDQRGIFAITIAIIVFIVLVIFIIPMSNGHSFLECFKAAGIVLAIGYVIWKGASLLARWIMRGEP